MGKEKRECTKREVENERREKGEGRRRNIETSAPCVLHFIVYITDSVCVCECVCVRVCVCACVYTVCSCVYMSFVIIVF